MAETPMPLNLDTNQPLAPSDSDSKFASDALRQLLPALKQDAALQLHPHGGPSISLPPIASTLIVRLLKDLAAGHAVMLIPIHAELTTQQVADLLGVSRPFVIKQLHDRRIPYHMAGSHRRILYADVLKYQNQLAAQRASALDELARDSQQSDSAA